MEYTRITAERLRALSGCRRGRLTVTLTISENITLHIKGKM